MDIIQTPKRERSVCQSHINWSIIYWILVPEKLYSILSCRLDRPCTCPAPSRNTGNKIERGQDKVKSSLTTFFPPSPAHNCTCTMITVRCKIYTSIQVKHSMPASSVSIQDQHPMSASNVSIHA
jgi:hypothetical protein